MVLTVENEGIGGTWNFVLLRRLGHVGFLAHPCGLSRKLRGVHIGTRIGGSMIERQLHPMDLIRRNHANSIDGLVMEDRDWGRDERTIAVIVSGSKGICWL